jgi:hypothetical protein
MTVPIFSISHYVTLSYVCYQPHVMNNCHDSLVLFLASWNGVKIHLFWLSRTDNLGNIYRLPALLQSWRCEYKAKADNCVVLATSFALRTAGVVKCVVRATFCQQYGLFAASLVVTWQPCVLSSVKWVIYDIRLVYVRQHGNDNLDISYQAETDWKVADGSRSIMRQPVLLLPGQSHKITQGYKNNIKEIDIKASLGRCRRCRTSR